MDMGSIVFTSYLAVSSNYHGFIVLSFLAYQENVNKLLTKPCRVKWKNHFLLAGLLYLYFLRMTVAARIVALSNQVIPCAGVVPLIAFFHLLHAPAVRVVEFVCVGIDYIIGAS